RARLSGRAAPQHRRWTGWGRRAVDRDEADATAPRAEVRGGSEVDVVARARSGPVAQTEMERASRAAEHHPAHERHAGRDGGRSEVAVREPPTVGQLDDDVDRAGDITRKRD